MRQCGTNLSMLILDTTFILVYIVHCKNLRYEKLRERFKKNTFGNDHLIGCCFCALKIKTIYVPPQIHFLGLLLRAHLLFRRLLLLPFHISEDNTN